MSGFAIDLHCLSLTTLHTSNSCCFYTQREKIYGVLKRLDGVDQKISNNYAWHSVQ